MDIATLEYLKDTEHIKRVAHRSPEEAIDLESMFSDGFKEGYAQHTASLIELLSARGGDITRPEYEAYKRGVKDAQNKAWAEKQTG